MKVALKCAQLVTVVLLYLTTIVFAQADSREKSLVLSTRIVSREYTANDLVEMKLQPGVAINTLRGAGFEGRVLDRYVVL